MKINNFMLRNIVASIFGIEATDVKLGGSLSPNTTLSSVVDQTDLHRYRKLSAYAYQPNIGIKEVAVVQHMYPKSGKHFVVAAPALPEAIEDACPGACFLLVVTEKYVFPPVGKNGMTPAKPRLAKSYVLYDIQECVVTLPKRREVPLFVEW